jgi:isocitrate/isopropylmalate dehydrogenase
MILSAVMMLDWLGETEIAGRIRLAVAEVIARGEVQTYDMLKLRGGPQAIADGAATTVQMADAIISEL